MDAAARLDRRPRSRARPLRLLCAEDNPFGRVVLNTMAAALGHRIDFVDAGEAVVDAARGGSYDARADGRDAAWHRRHRRDAAHPRAWRRRPAPVPIIGISGAAGRRGGGGAAAGMNAYLVKPVGPRGARAALAAVDGAKLAP